MTILKLYGASGCGPCKTLKPILQSVIQNNQSVQYQYIDVDSNQSEAKQLGIKSVPVVIVQKNGVESARIVGLHSSSVYEQAIS